MKILDLLNKLILKDESKTEDHLELLKKNIKPAYLVMPVGIDTKLGSYYVIDSETCKKAGLI